MFMSSAFRNLPSVGELLESPPLKSLVHRASQNVVVSRVRQFMDDMRTQVQSAAANVPVPAVGELAQRIADWIASQERPALVPVINATGAIVPGHLGGAPMAEEAIAAIAAIARGYSAADFDSAIGLADPRLGGVEKLMHQLAGAESAIVASNHAAATVVTLAALGAGREIVVSRSQLVADGDYRLPELIAASGAKLREVGTTNITRADDYASAIGPNTAAIAHVEPASYALTGTCEQTPLVSLVTLARRHGVPLIADLGSAAVQGLGPYGLPDVPLVGDAIRAGADIAIFGGERWLGGPQCGIIAGRRSLLERIARHPLFTALAASKLTLAALAATLRLHTDPDLAERSVPILSLLATPLENLQNRAERLAPQMAAAGIADVRIVSGQAHVAGTPLTRLSLPTVCLALAPRTGTADMLAAALRSGALPVIGRVEDGSLLLDLRSVAPREDTLLVSAIEALRARPKTAEPAAPEIGPM
jgi:L-seryl-tRNA(Ser) seleniumtransferase